MTINIDQAIKWICPLCEKPLANDEYHNAMQRLEIQVKKKYEKEYENMKVKIEENLKHNFNEQLRSQQKEFLDQMKMNQRFISQKEEQILQKEEEINSLKKEQLTHNDIFKREIENQFKNEIMRLTDIIKVQDIQMQRAKEEAEVLKKKLSQNQSELTGEVGERNLYEMLTQAFKEEQDIFERSKRGTAMGDIIHYIKTANGILETKIVYDNKSSSTVTNHDIEKAQKYKKIHNTNHVIIVSSNLPKRDIENRLIGQKEGIVLVHPDIVVEEVKLIRQEIIRTSNYAKSKIEKESKEAELYDFITSDNFLGIIEEINFEYYHMLKDQETEEKDHQTLWKKRKNRFKKLIENINFLTNKIDRITTNSS